MGRYIRVARARNICRSGQQGNLIVSSAAAGVVSNEVAAGPSDVADDSFDPVRPGYPDSLWQKMLVGAKPWTPASGALIVVSPHPDDEILGAGGLIHEWAALGHSVIVVSVTDGEAAYAGCPALGRLRARELQTALRSVSAVHVPTLRLSIPDGRVPQFRNRLHRALSSLLTAGATVVAPYEKDGHPDHNATGEVCLAVSKSLGAPVVRYPIWRWHHGDPKDLHDARWGKFALSGEARRAKKQAVRCFASQLAPAHHEPIVPPHVLAYFERPFEAFIL
jgi:LmbE family N-acetylglucosaminyl deacetylase